MSQSPQCVDPYALPYAAPDRPYAGPDRGGWAGAAAWFVAGGAGIVALIVAAFSLAHIAGADVALLGFAGGVCAAVWGMLRLPLWHRIGLLLGAILTPAALFGYVVYEFLTTPWGF